MGEINYLLYKVNGSIKPTIKIGKSTSAELNVPHKRQGVESMKQQNNHNDYPTEVLQRQGTTVH